MEVERVRVRAFRFLRAFLVAATLVLSSSLASYPTHAAASPSSDSASPQEENLTFRTEGEVASWQVLVSALFVAGLLAVSLGIIAFSRRRPGLFSRTQDAGPSIEVLETRRLSPKLHSVLLRAGEDKLLVFDNGTAIRVHVLRESEDSGRD